MSSAPRSRSSAALLRDRGAEDIETEYDEVGAVARAPAVTS